MLTINALKISNQTFWTGFFATSFPTALNAEIDMSLSKMIVDANTKGVCLNNLIT